jgi:allantoinase
MRHENLYPDIYLRNAQIVTETVTFRGGLTITGGKISQWIHGNPDLDAEETLDAGSRLVLPGLIDAHVHFSEPGRTHWEGFATGTRAAAAGGVTTVVEMPLNASPPTIAPAALQAKVQAAVQSAVVDYALWGGLVDNNLDQLEALHAGGVVGFKAFLCESATDFRRIDDDLLYAGLQTARRLNTVVGVHAENEWLTRYLTQALQASGRCDRYAWGKARPPEAELEAIQRAIFWSKVTGGRLHLVHVSQAQGIQAAVAAKQAGVPVTVETCPHYLFFDEEDFVRIGPAAKCAPPLRPRSYVEALWQAVLAGQVDVIASDHSPCTWAEKERGQDDIWLAWGGISGLQSTLSVLLTEGVHRRGLSLSALVRMTSANPARLFGLYPRKGSLIPGADADLVIVDPEPQFALRAGDLYYKNRHSVYVDHSFQGVIHTTLVRGTPVYSAGDIVGRAGYGKWVKPSSLDTTLLDTAMEVS